MEPRKPKMKLTRKEIVAELEELKRRAQRNLEFDKHVEHGIYVPEWQRQVRALEIVIEKWQPGN
jgi:hypothetical protein